MQSPQDPNIIISILMKVDPSVHYRHPREGSSRFEYPYPYSKTIKTIVIDIYNIYNIRDPYENF